MPHAWKVPWYVSSIIVFSTTVTKAVLSIIDQYIMLHWGGGGQGGQMPPYTAAPWNISN